MPTAKKTTNSMEKFDLWLVLFTQYLGWQIVPLVNWGKLMCSYFGIMVHAEFQSVIKERIKLYSLKNNKKIVF